VANEDGFYGAIPTEGLPPEFVMWLTHFVNASRAEAETTEVPSGSIVMFFNDAAPTGWEYVTGFEDVTIVTADTVDEGGSTGGSWTISGVTVDNYTLTVADVPSLDVTGFPNTGSGLSRLVATTNAALTGPVTRPTSGGGGPHNHGLTADGTWRPAYIKGIPCKRA